MSKLAELSQNRVRRVLAVAGAVVLVAGVSACGASSSSDQPSGAAGETTPAAPATTPDLPTEPEVPAGKVSLNFEVANCADCTITALPTGSKQFDIPLNGGKGSTLIDKDKVTKTFFTISGQQYGSAMASSALITQVLGKAPGASVSSFEVKNAKEARICLAAPTSQHVNIKANTVPVSTGDGTMARFWADPTLAGAKGAYGELDLHNGVAGVQNSDLC